MFKLSRKTEYALMALQELAKLQVLEPVTLPISSKDLAARILAPQEVTAKVLQALAADHRVLKVTNGSQGGYELMKDLSQISLFELSSWIEGSPALAKCLEDSSGCDALSNCTLSKPMNRLNAKFIEFSRSIPLSEIFATDEKLNNDLVENTHG